MPISFQVSFDCHDPAVLTRFWAVALDYQPQPPPAGFATWDEFADSVGIPPENRNDLGSVVDPDGALPRLLFQKVPEAKSVKNRVHLDVNAGAGAPDEQERRRRVDAHVRRCVTAGAEVQRDAEERGERWVVLTDPEGNEFCVQ